MICTDFPCYWAPIENVWQRLWGQNKKKSTVVSEVFHPILTPDSNLSTLRCEKLSASKGNWIQKNYNNKFVHSQLITRLKSETRTEKKPIPSIWNVALRPFSQLTTWKLYASNRFHSFGHVLWVSVSRPLSGPSLRCSKVFNKLKSVITRCTKKTCTNEFFLIQRSACSLS